MNPKGESTDIVGAAVAAGTAVKAKAQAGAGRAAGGSTFAVAVAGSGVFGAWTARHLLTRGLRVALIDEYALFVPRRGPAQPQDARVTTEMRERIDNLPILPTVDVVDLSQVSAEFRSLAESEAVALYERRAQASRASGVPAGCECPLLRSARSAQERLPPRCLDPAVRVHLRALLEEPQGCRRGSGPRGRVAPR